MILRLIFGDNFLASWPCIVAYTSVTDFKEICGMIKMLSKRGFSLFPLFQKSTRRLSRALMESSLCGCPMLSRRRRRRWWSSSVSAIEEVFLSSSSFHKFLLPFLFDSEKTVREAVTKKKKRKADSITARVEKN